MTNINPFSDLGEFPDDIQLEEAANRCLELYELNTWHPAYECVESDSPDFKGHRVRVEQVCEWWLSEAGYDSELVDASELRLPQDDRPEIAAFTDSGKVRGYTDFINKRVVVADYGVTTRFAWSHELKHVLNCSLFKLPATGSDEWKKKDVSANKFARYLCLPKEKFRERVEFFQNELGTADKKISYENMILMFKYLAHDFQVSGLTVVLRVKDFGLPQSVVDRIFESKEYIFPTKPMIKKCTKL